MTSKIPSLFRDPFPVDSFRRQLDRLVSDFWPSELGRTAGEEWLHPAIDMVEEEGQLKITAELPGLDETDIQLEFRDNQLILKGEKRFEKPAAGEKVTEEIEQGEEEKKATKEPGYHVMERRYGAFMRSIPIPFEADPEQISASCHKGVLTITIPKPAEEKQPTHKIDVEFKKG